MIADRDVEIAQTVGDILELCNKHGFEYEFTEDGTLCVWVKSIEDLSDHYANVCMSIGEDV